MPVWLEITLSISQFLATVTLAGIAAWIALQQKRINEHRHRFDLFDKRFAVYSALMRFINSVTADLNMSLDDNRKLLHETANARFLFDDDVNDFIEAVRHRAIQIRKFANQYEQIQALPDNDRTRRGHENEKDIMWIADQYALADEIFKPYLKFGKRVR